MANLRPEGSYVGKILSHAVTENEKKTGEVDIQIVFSDVRYISKETGEEVPVDGNAYVNIYPRSDNEKSVGYALDQIEAIPARYEQLDKPVESSGLDGIEVKLWMKHEDYNGESKERWAISTMKHKESSPNAKNLLASVFGMAANGRKKTTTTAAPKTATVASAADDSPF
jgi:hypothetical protein